jgi:hypothetical protein
MTNASPPDSTARRAGRLLLAVPFGLLGAVALLASTVAGGLAPFVLLFALAMLLVAWGIARAKTTRWLVLSIIGGGLLVGYAILVIHGLSRAHW